METRHSDHRKTNRRYRRAAGPLWENSSLRDELNDEQAQRLLDWGTSYLKKIVDETAEMSDEAAEKVVEAQTNRVSGVIRQVNRLAGTAAGGEQQELSQHLTELRRNLDGLLRQDPDVPQDLEQKLSSGQLDNEQLFESLMAMLGGEEE